MQCAGPDVEAAGLLLADAPPARARDVRGPRRGRRAAAFGAGLALLGVAGAAAWRARGTARPAAVGEDVAGGAIELEGRGLIDDLLSELGKQAYYLKMQAQLEAAEAKYNGTTARAFAAMSKLTYCGPRPGLYGAVSMSCSTVNLPGAASACEKAMFEVVPGTVKFLTNGDPGEYVDAAFGYAARLRTKDKDAAIKEGGVMLVFRGSVNTIKSVESDKDVSMNSSMTGCNGCKVHDGYWESYAGLKDSIFRAIGEYWCTPWDKTCTIYVSGHGSGAAVATIAAWELSRAGYQVGASYVFGSPRIGNFELAKRLTAEFSGEPTTWFSRPQGPIFQVTYRRDSVPRWPYGAKYAPWGVEAHYDSLNSSDPQVCYAGLKQCGVRKIPKSSLELPDHCKSPLADGKSFCEFADWGQMCYGGLGFEVTRHLHSLMPWADAFKQPEEEQAADWSPSEKDGFQKNALAKARDPSEMYSLKVLRAFATLAKISYCGELAGLRSAVQMSCSGSYGPCSAAGFGVVPNTVHTAVAPWGWTPGAIFAYTALVRRTEPDLAEGPFFMPAEACVVAFRGGVMAANQAMSRDVKLVPLNWWHCPGCYVSSGLKKAWTAIREGVTDALNKTGCVHNETGTNKVFVTGHGSGGSLAAVAAYFLDKYGYNVQLSWSFEGNRVGNAAFMHFLHTQLGKGSRPVGMWQVTHANDAAPRLPGRGKGYGEYSTRVHFDTSNATAHQLCTTPGDKDRECGSNAYSRSDLEKGHALDAFCSPPYAPRGEMCAWRALPFQCHIGGYMA